MNIRFRDLKNMFDAIPEWALDKDVIIRIGKYETFKKESVGSIFRIDYANEELLLII